MKVKEHVRQRRRDAEKALQPYTGSRTDAAGNLITDLLHLVAENGEDAIAVAALAVRNFRFEADPENAERDITDISDALMRRIGEAKEV